MKARTRKDASQQKTKRTFGDYVGYAGIAILFMTGIAFMWNNLEQIFDRHTQQVVALTVSAPRTVSEDKGTEKDYIGKCSVDAFKASFDVYLSNAMLSASVQGELVWLENKNTFAVVIKKTPRGQSHTSIISHEVSHFVDLVVAGLGIHDTETRAYLQGYLTDCVTRAVNAYTALHPYNDASQWSVERGSFGTCINIDGMASTSPRVPEYPNAKSCDLLIPKTTTYYEANVVEYLSNPVTLEAVYGGTSTNAR